MEESMSEVQELFGKLNAVNELGSPKAVDYGETGFMLRNRPIYDQIGSLKGQSVLDLGCGNGGLLLCGLFAPETYVGVDIIPEFAEQVQGILTKKCIKGVVHNRSILDLDAEAFEPYDWVLLNGVNTYPELFADQDAFLNWYAKALKFAKGLVITSISERAAYRQPNRVYYTPEFMVSLAVQHSKHVVFDHTYAPHDFMVVSRRV